MDDDCIMEEDALESSWKQIRSLMENMASYQEELTLLR